MCHAHFFTYICYPPPLLFSRTRNEANQLILFHHFNYFAQSVAFIISLTPKSLTSSVVNFLIQQSYKMCIKSFMVCVSGPYQHKSWHGYYRDIDNDGCQLNFEPLLEHGYREPMCPPKDITSLRRGTAACHLHRPPDPLPDLLYLPPVHATKAPRAAGVGVSEPPSAQDQPNDPLVEEATGAGAGVPPEPTSAGQDRPADPSEQQAAAAGVSIPDPPSAQDQPNNDPLEEEATGAGVSVPEPPSALEDQPNDPRGKAPPAGFFNWSSPPANPMQRTFNRVRRCETAVGGGGAGKSKPR